MIETQALLWAGTLELQGYADTTCMIQAKHTLWLDMFQGLVMST